MELTRTNYSSGAPLEEKSGYSRMIKVGPFIYIGGTTAVLPDGTVHFVAKVYPYGVETLYIYEPGSKSYVIVERHTKARVSGPEFFHSLERDLNLESIQE